MNMKKYNEIEALSKIKRGNGNPIINTWNWLCEKYGMEMPLIEAVQAIIEKGADPKEIVQDLMSRKLKQENM